MLFEEGAFNNCLIIISAENEQLSDPFIAIKQNRGMM